MRFKRFWFQSVKMSGDVDGEVAGLVTVEGSLQLRLGGEEALLDLGGGGESG